MKKDMLKGFLESIKFKKMSELEESLLRAKTLISLDIKLDELDDDYFINPNSRLGRGYDKRA
tara:strand:+ start:321 stop:506 length:186 start_codon:yes stop_codon:yes gene_type:complete